MRLSDRCTRNDGIAMKQDKWSMTFGGYTDEIARLSCIRAMKMASGLEITSEDVREITGQIRELKETFENWVIDNPFPIYHRN